MPNKQKAKKQQRRQGIAKGGKEKIMMNQSKSNGAQKEQAQASKEWTEEGLMSFIHNMAAADVFV